MGNQSDNEVARRVRDGEHEAYWTLFHRYYRSVERYALCLSQDRDVACIAASETFVRAFKAARHTSAAPRYPAHLFTLCRRQLVRGSGARAVSDFLRPRPPLAADSIAHDLTDLPLALILSAERDAVIQSALDSLDVDDRELIHLVFEPYLDCDDVGIILKEPSQERLVARVYAGLIRLSEAVAHADACRRKRTGRQGQVAKQWART